MQAFQTSVYCGLGIFHFFFGVWFLVFRFGFDVVFRFSYVGTTFFSTWAALISNSFKLISNSCKLISNSCETSLFSTCHCWRSSRNLIVEMSKFIGFACGFWYWSNFFPVFRFWMIFFYGFVVSNRPQYLPRYASWHLDCILVVIVRWRVWLDTVYMQARMQ